MPGDSPAPWSALDVAHQLEGDSIRHRVALRAADPDGFVDHFRIASLPAYGSLYAAPDGATPLAVGDLIAARDGAAAVWFQPDAGWDGTTAFDYQAADVALVAWGDSLLPPSLTDMVAALVPGLVTLNAGRGGQWADQILARQGGWPLTLHLAGDTIPASGSVAVTARGDDPISGRDIDILFGAGGWDSGIAGTLAGIPVIYASDGAGNQTIVRQVPGSALAIPDGAVFVPDLAAASRTSLTFINAGTNGTGIVAPEHLTAIVQSAVDYLAPGTPYIVGGLIGRAATDPNNPELRDIVAANNAALEAAFGDNYLDLFTPPTPDEMTATGYSPTAADLADIAAGYWPRGMYYDGDATHLNLAGQQLEALRVANHIAASGLAPGYSDAATATLVLAAAPSLGLPVAADDAAGTSEGAALMGLDVLANDFGGDGASIVQLGGAPVAVGGTVALASGARVTLRAGGKVDYDPGQAFAWLSGVPGSANRSATDQFTYGLANGSTATVTVTILGADSPGDVAYGTAGANGFGGTSFADTYDLSSGGADVVVGGRGNDLFLFGGALDAADHVDGGEGDDDIVRIAGDYTGSARLLLGPNSLAGVESLQLGLGYDYDVETLDANVPGGGLLKVVAATLGSADSLTFDGLAESDGAFHVHGGAGGDSLTGGALNDQLAGGAGDDQLHGGAGDDFLTGGDGLDQVFGGDGDDEAFGGAGEDTLHGGGGADHLLGGSGDDNIAGEAGDDTLHGDSGHDTLSGGAGQDLIYGGADNDTIFGGEDADQLYGGDGADTIDGGFGADKLFGEAHDDRFVFTSVRFGSAPIAGMVDGGTGYDTVDLTGASLASSGTIDTSPGLLVHGITVGSQRFAVANVELFLFGDGDDNVWLPAGHAAAIELRAGGGNDYLIGSGAARLLGEAGDDLFFVSGSFGTPATAGLIDGGGGTNTLRTYIAFTVDLAAQTASSGTSSFVVSSIRDVVVTLSGYASSVSGDAGDNRLSVHGTGDDGPAGATFDGRGGNDTLTGGAGMDALVGGAGYDTLDGGGGNDSLDGGGDNDLLYGRAGDDAMHGGGGSDYLQGESGNDVLDGGTGADTMFGGIGDDTYHVDHIQDFFAEGGNEGTDTVVTTLATYTLGAHLENLTYTGVVRSLLIGNAHDNTIVGGEGMDFLDASGGGADRLFGGGGDDGLSFEATFGAGDKADGDDGYDQVALRGDYSGLVFAEDALVGIEALKLFAGEGGAANSYDLTTADGNLAAGATMQIKGNKLSAAEAFTFDGSAESDGSFQLRGGAGDDTLIGGAGADLILGKLGADLLTGNGGADNFVYIAAAESTAAARDTILDFAAEDVIDLSSIDAVSGGADDAFHWASGNAFTGTAGELTLSQAGGVWLLAGDTDGDGAADLLIGIVGAGGYLPLTSDVVL